MFEFRLLDGFIWDLFLPKKDFLFYVFSDVLADLVNSGPQKCIQYRLIFVHLSFNVRSLVVHFSYALRIFVHLPYNLRYFSYNVRSRFGHYSCNIRTCFGNFSYNERKGNETT